VCDSVSATNITMTAGSTITVNQSTNVLQAGDVFQLFNSANLNLNLANITISLPRTGPFGGDYTWNTNNLASGGSITLASVTGLVNTNSPTMLFNVATPGSLTIGWPTNLGWRLVYQSNSVTTGLLTNSTDWVTVPGSTSVTQMVIPIGATNEVFFQMIYP
jgi:hypothetical protein